MPTPTLGSFAPRKWQNDALERWLGSGRRGIVEVITGGGKTKFAMMCSLAWFESEPDGLVEVIVPSLSLQDQWVVALENDLGLAEGQVSTRPDRVNSTTLFLVMVVNSARTKQPATERPVMLVADECHRYASPENERALQHAWSATIGLSATAEREYDEGLSEVLIPALGSIIFSYTLADGLRDKVVTGYQALNVSIDLNTDEQIEYDLLSRKLGAAIAQDHLDTAKRIAMQRARVVNRAEWRVPAALALISRYRSRRIMVFCEEIVQADQLTRLLLARNHAASVYHSHLGVEIRRDNLRQFRRGVNDVIVACRALDEGVDIPEADMAVIVSSTATRRQRIQRIGRALRAAPGKSDAIVVTIYATEAERERLFVEEDEMGKLITTKWERVSHA